MKQCGISGKQEVLPAMKGKIMEKKDVLKIVDHTLLSQTATWTDIKEILRFLFQIKR